MSKTKSNQIAKAILRDYIENAVLPPGGQLPSVRDLQVVYGTSSTSVSHALSMLEAQGFIWRQQGKGCFVAESGPSADSIVKSNAIGLVIPMPASESLLMRLFIGVEGLCHRAGYTVMLGISGWEYSQEEAQVRRLIAAGCRAIVINPVFRMQEQRDRDYLARGPLEVPLILVDMAPDGYEHSRILFDNYRAGYEMTQLLLSRGHKRIAFMRVYSPDGQLMHRSNQERLEGYRDAMGEAGHVVHDEDVWPISVTPSYDINDIVNHLEAWRQQKERPTALIAIEDNCVAWTVGEARKLGIKVPRDLTIAGFDNLPIGESMHPPFPTTQANFGLAGEVAARLALRHIAGTLTAPVTYMLPVPIIPRDAAPNPGPAPYDTYQARTIVEA